MQIDLRNFIATKVGTWSERAESFKASRLVLSDPGDGVALVGPLRISVTLQGENSTQLYRGELENMTASDVAGVARAAPTAAMMAASLGSRKQERHQHVVYSYTLDIPPLQVWTYLVREPEITGLLGTNRGFNVVIQPGGSECVDDHPGKDGHGCCDPGCGCGGNRGCGGGKQCGCGCGGKQPTPGDDLPCDYAVANIPNTGRFFPAACEPCAPDAYISVPPMPGPSGLAVRPAAGGCERPRYFTGMFITREDMEAEQRFFRLKMKLHNRASGAGVVWGLCLAREGNAIAVHPGYAVDCCGNDLTVTTPYRVDIPALLRDPAAAQALSTPGPHRMHLLLEYFECPEDPRPVHGDPCSPTTTSCEMSRVRETVRLRLVPPRDHDTRGPIQRFLDELKKIKPVDPTLPSNDGGGAGDTSGELPPGRVPWRFDVRVTGDQETAQLQPDTATEARAGYQFLPESSTVNLVVEAGWTLTGSVTERDSAGSTRPVATLSNAGATWTGLIPPRNQRTFYDVSWRAQDAAGIVMEGTTQLVYFGLSVDSNEFTFLELTVPPSAVRVSRFVRPFPCLTEACAEAAGDDHPLFPVIPPFLHADPYRPGQPADPKVLVLAALYGWLAGELARGNGEGYKRAADLYVSAARLLFGLERSDQLLGTARKLKQLLADWCKASLYPGPKCEGEPHGVVIGCALVQGGDVDHVDPWGGRRYVVHYPLLSHWGQMIGLAPLDLTAQRFFSMLCCVAGLPGIDQRRAPDRGDTTGPGSFGPAANQPISVGPAFVFLRGTDARASARDDARLNVTRTERVGMMDFAAHLVTAMRQPAGAEAAGSPRVRYVMDGGASIVVPAPPGAAGSPGSPGGEAAPAPVAPPARLDAIVGRVIHERSGEASVPPLLRGFATELSSELARTLPLAATPAEAAAANERLRAAGVTDVGTLLARDPEALHERVLAGAHGAALGALVDGAEADANRVAAAVAASLGSARGRGLATRTDLVDAERRAVFVKELRKQLGEDAPKAAVLDRMVLKVAKPDA